MVVNQKRTGTASSIPGGLAWGALVGLLITIGGSALIAKLTDCGILQENKIGYGVMIMLIVSAYADAVLSWVKIKRRRAMVCALSGCLYMLILLAITALFFGGQYSAVGETALLILCGSVLAMLPALKGNRGQGRRKIRIPNR